MEMEEGYAGSDEEEALSFCDLVVERRPCESSSRDSNAGRAEHEDFVFDFGRCGPAPHQPSPADDLFHDGRLLPLSVQRSRSESGAEIWHRKSTSFGENRRQLLDEKMQAWRIDSVESQIYYAGNFGKSCGSKKYQLEKTSRSVDPVGKPKAKAHRTSCTSPRPPAPHSGGKTSLKWQFFTLGLMKTPPMKLEDMRLRQGKPGFNSGAEKSVPSVLKRSVSCNYEEGPRPAKKEPGPLKFQQKSKSVRENMDMSMVPEENQTTLKSKGWRMLAPLTSLNGCKASTNSVINCSAVAKKRVDGGGGLADRGGTPAKMLPFYADQNSLNLAQGSCKLAAFGNGRGISVHQVDHHRLSFRNTALQGIRFD